MSALPRGQTDYRSRLASQVSVSVRLAAASGAEAAADRAFVEALGKRSVMSSIGSLRPAPLSNVEFAFERLIAVVESQSHLTLIAQEKEERVGFLLLLDALPDEVTLLAQGFVAYMAVEPSRQRSGAGTALLAAAEEEARRRGLPYVALMVTEENAAARALYERAGYRTERRLLCKPLTAQ
jgi:ribosomal protein S18 acetylase RimI-like enzyme